MRLPKSNLNRGIFLYVLGNNMLLLGFAFLISGVVSCIYGEKERLFFLLASSVMFMLGAFTAYKNKNFTSQISKKDGRLIVGLMWLIVPLLGALPYMFTLGKFSFVNSLFESYSGYTTTGASIIGNIASVPKGLLFYRSLTQWIGGLGFAMLVIIFVRNFSDGSKNLFNAEFNSIEKEKERPHIKSTVYRIFGIYTAFTILCCTLLTLGEMNFFEAICHSFSTISTGGFSVSDGNIGAYSDYSQIVIMVFMFLSGISYFLLIWFVRGKWRRVFHDEQLRMYCFMTLAFGIGFSLYFLSRSNMDFLQSVKTSFFYVASTLSSTGFDLKAHNLGIFVSAGLVLLMFIGGCSASSSTGLKIIRAVILLKYIPVAMKRVFHPRAIIPVRYNNKALRDSSVSLVFGFFFLFFVIFLFGVIGLTMAGNDFTHAFALSAASISNIGPVMGSLADGFSYNDLTSLSKYLIITLMLIGRLEIYAFFAILSPSVWSKR